MATNNEIFLGSGASLTLVPELELCITLDTSSTTTRLDTSNAFQAGMLLVPDLYVGCTLDLYDADVSNVTPASTHTITGNTTTAFTITPAHGTGTLVDETDFAIVRSYAAPCPGPKYGSISRLNADNWLGLVESASFPNVDIEMKQLNLQLGGSRNFTHQYKGIKTASGGNINLAAHTGAWLYYAFGKCATLKCELANITMPSGFYGVTAGDVYIDNGGGSTFGSEITNTAHVETGPIFYKAAVATSGITQAKTLMPPILQGSDVSGQLEKLVRTTSTATAVDKAITYTFAESETSELPSFALEQSIAKNPDTTLTTETGDASESHTFVRIARGNRVNTMTITANENEELKLTMDLNTAAVNKLTRATNYEARGGQTTNTSLFNYENSEVECLDPFFFSKGSFEIFGQQFLKITNLSLTINNNLQDKRFIGIGNKDIKMGIPAQRNYELSFTALVTDDALFEELFTEAEVPSGTSTINLQFDKDNTEQIVLKFEDYHITASNWTIPDDKGPITVEATVMPRKLNTCTVKTHWVLQG